jgi:hypothetical protein
MLKNNEKVESSGDKSPDETSMKSVYGPLALFVLGAVLLMGFASNTRAEKEEMAKIPDEITSHSNCEVTAKSATLIGGVIWDTIQSSCGYFNDPLVFEMEKGKVYDIEVAKSSSGQSRISKVTLSSDD